MRDSPRLPLPLHLLLLPKPFFQRTPRSYHRPSPMAPVLLKVPLTPPSWNFTFGIMVRQHHPVVPASLAFFLRKFALLWSYKSPARRFPHYGSLKSVWCIPHSYGTEAGTLLLTEVCALFGSPRFSPNTSLHLQDPIRDSNLHLVVTSSSASLDYEEGDTVISHFSRFLMTLTVLRDTGQVFCRMPHSGNLS